ncbi:MAG: CrcB family protein [Bowdeniella nasicola]|nr:CrcB family protein [Bowdeniella nasicola]
MIFALALAAWLGGMARFGLDTLIRRGKPGVLGIIVVNTIGSLLLGILAALAGILHFRGGTFVAAPIDPPVWFTIVGVGFCGAFTTFSTAILDVFALVRTRHWLRATGLLVLGVLTALGAAGLGVMVISSVG